LPGKEGNQQKFRSKPLKTSWRGTTKRPPLELFYFVNVTREWGWAWPGLFRKIWAPGVSCIFQTKFPARRDSSVSLFGRRKARVCGSSWRKSFQEDQLRLSETFLAASKTGPFLGRLKLRRGGRSNAHPKVTMAWEARRFFSGRGWGRFLHLSRFTRGSGIT